jgi:hypothetical protein
MDAHRRDAILRLAASGALGAAGLSGVISRALAKGDLPPGVHDLEGTVTVNGAAAKVGTPLKVGDRVATGRDSRAVIVIGKDAFLMHAETSIDTRGDLGILDTLLLETGRLLTVMSKKPVTVTASKATIGIRGTGFYLEIDPASVYFCLCYGEALVAGPGMMEKTVMTTHHESPLILAESGGVMRADPGPFRGHTDAELVMLETLCDREPPFMKGGKYPAGKYP